MSGAATIQSMDCHVVREALSAELDGEETGVSSELVQAHLAACLACTEWSTAAYELHRELRVTVAPPIPDLTASILESIGSNQDSGKRNGDVRACRWILAGCGLLQLAMTLPIFLGGGNGPVHVDHELGSWDVALAIGLLFAALRPARAWGMLPLVGAIVAMLATTSVFDIATGHATFESESTHLFEVIGLFFLWMLAHMQRGTPSRANLTIASAK